MNQSNGTPSTTEFRDSLRAARRVSTPLICVRTADPASARSHVIASLNGEAKNTPLVAYDLINGLHGINQPGTEAAGAALNSQAPPPDPSRSVTAETLALAKALAEDSILFFDNPQRLWEQADIAQAIWNLRDAFKEAGGRMLVLVTTRGAILPAELANDVMVFDEPLPSIEDLRKMADALFPLVPIKQPDETTMNNVLDALIGLPMFQAEQSLSMSTTPTKGVDIPRVWDRKKTTIENTRGLKVYRGGVTFADVRGCDALVEYLTALMLGEDAPHGVVFIDEINDAFGGASGGDTSGTKQDMQGTILKHLEDNNSDGILLLGPPGTGKTLIGKATASVANRLMIEFDFAGMQSGIVGSSGENLRTGLSVVDATMQGRSLWIGSCNTTSNLSPQLRRRFRDGSFFVDAPDADGRSALWTMYEKKCGVKGPRPDDEGWTGAEIRNCCEKARRLKLSLRDAAKYIVPVAISDAGRIETLRREASGKFLSASKPGTYTYNPPTAAPAPESRGRTFRTVGKDTQ